MGTSRSVRNTPNSTSLRSADSVFYKSYSKPVPKPRSRKQRSSTRSTQLSSRSRNTQRKVRKKPATKVSTQSVACGPTQFDTQESIFDFAPAPNVLGNDGRYGEPITRTFEDPVSQFSTQNTPNVPSQVAARTALEQFADLQQRSRSRREAFLIGERNLQPPRRQEQLPGKVMRCRISQNRFVSDPNLRRFKPLLSVRPIRLESPLPQFRQLRIRDVINNLHEVRHVSLAQWREMGFGEFKHHDIIVKVPGSVLTRYKLMSDFRQDFENPRISLSSTNGSPTDIRGTH